MFQFRQAGAGKVKVEQEAGSALYSVSGRAEARAFPRTAECSCLLLLRKANTSARLRPHRFSTKHPAAPWLCTRAQQWPGKARSCSRQGSGARVFSSRLQRLHHSTPARRLSIFFQVGAAQAGRWPPLLYYVLHNNSACLFLLFFFREWSCATWGETARKGHHLAGERKGTAFTHLASWTSWLVFWARLGATDASLRGVDATHSQFFPTLACSAYVGLRM